MTKEEIIAKLKPEVKKMVDYHPQIADAKKAVAICKTYELQLRSELTKQEQKVQSLKDLLPVEDVIEREEVVAARFERSTQIKKTKMLLNDVLNDLPSESLEEVFFAIEKFLQPNNNGNNLTNNQNNISK